jgi:hypothetical protein
VRNGFHTQIIQPEGGVEREVIEIIGGKKAHRQSRQQEQIPRDSFPSPINEHDGQGKENGRGIVAALPAEKKERDIAQNRTEKKPPLLRDQRLRPEEKQQSRPEAQQGKGEPRRPRACTEKLERSRREISGQRRRGAVGESRHAVPVPVGDDVAVIEPDRCVARPLDALRAQRHQRFIVPQRIMAKLGQQQKTPDRQRKKKPAMPQHRAILPHARRRVDRKKDRRGNRPSMRDHAG